MTDIKTQSLKNEKKDNVAGRPSHERGGFRRGRGGGRPEKPKSEYDQKTLDLRRVARVVRGGRRFNFMAITAIGNRRGKVGVGVGKGADVSLAMEKSFRDAKKHLLILKLTKDFSISHEVSAKYSASRINLRPAKGRGVAAGSVARIILNLGGVRDISAKFVSKSKNKLNNARVVIAALSQLAEK